MANVIDELLIVLNLDPTKFNAAQKAALTAFRKTQEEAAKSAKDIESQGKKILNVFSDLKREAITLMAVFLGGRGIKDAVMHITQLDASASRLSRRVNANVHDIEIWRSVIQQAGGAAEDADTAFQGMADALAEQGQSGVLHQGLLNIFSRVPVATEDRNNPIAVLKALADARSRPEFQGPTGGASFAALANQFPGMSSGLLNVLVQGRAKLDEYLASAEKAGVGDDKTGKAAERFNQSLVLLEQASLNVVRALETYLIPVIDKVTELFRGWVITPGSKEAKDLDARFNKHLRQKFGQSPLEPISDEEFERNLRKHLGNSPLNPVINNPPRRSTGGPLDGDILGGSVTNEDGTVTTFGPIGAKGAAASNTTHSRSSRDTTNNSNSITVDTVNMHLPNATDAPGMMKGLKGISGSYYQSFGASANSGAQ